MRFFANNEEEEEEVFRTTYQRDDDLKTAFTLNYMAYLFIKDK